jgi:hypothetical protein
VTRERLRRWAIGAATVVGVIAVAILLLRDDSPSPAPTPTTGPATITAPVPVPVPVPPVAGWGDWPGAPADLVAPPGGSQSVVGTDDAKEITVRRADGTVLAKATIDDTGVVDEARYFDAAEDLTLVIDGTRALPAAATTGGARVRCASRASASSGFRWTRFPIRWRLGARLPPGLIRSRALRALRRARATWNANRSHCPAIPDRSRARFAFAGATTRVTGRDGVSVVEFGDVDALGGVCVGTVACAITWVGAGRAVESDVRIDRVRPNGYFTGTARRRGLDLQSVMVHESGHTLGFGHVSARSVVMFPAIAQGGVAGRRLGRGDALANNRGY